MTQPIYDARQGYRCVRRETRGKNERSFSGGYRVFVGNLGSRTDVPQLKKECERYGPLVDCWVAR